MLSLIEIGQVVLEKILKFPQGIFAISLWPFYEQTDIFFTQGCFVLRLAENGPVGLKKKKTMRRVYDNDGEDNDDDGQRTNLDQKGHMRLRLR